MKNWVKGGDILSETRERVTAHQVGSNGKGAL